MQHVFSVPVGEMTKGSMVDLKSCPHLKDHPTAEFELAVVSAIGYQPAAGGAGCYTVSYEGIDSVGYPKDQVLKVAVGDDDTPDEPVKVTQIDGRETQILISQNLTDRWGDLNFAHATKKPLMRLVNDPPFLKSLVAQMWDEICFVTRKDGEYGILMEVEYTCVESEQSLLVGMEKDDSLKPRHVVNAALLDGMRKLAEKHPKVEFFLPDPSQIIEERPAAWAFFKDASIAKAEIEALGMALLEL